MTAEPSKDVPSASSNLTKLQRLPGLLAIIVFLLDQATKQLVLHLWPTPGSIGPTVIPGFFTLVHFQNRGAAWGMFSQHTWLLGCLSAAAFLLLAYFFDRLTERRPVLCLCYGLLLGGIAGNMFDRFFRPGVIDFLFFYFRDFNHAWPAFNVADSAITCTIILILIDGICRPNSPKPETEAPAEPPNA